MLIDANVLLYAVDPQSPHHHPAAEWLTRALNGRTRVGLPSQSIGAFVRIATHPRVTTNPLRPAQAWEFVQTWLDAEPVWVPPASGRTMRVLGDLIQRHGVTGNLVPDAMLAALAVEHGIPVVTADSDFARFPEVRVINPVVG